MNSHLTDCIAALANADYVTITSGSGIIWLPLPEIMRGATLDLLAAALADAHLIAEVFLQESPFAGLMHRTAMAIFAAALAGAYLVTGICSFIFPFPAMPTQKTRHYFSPACVSIPS